MIIKTQRDIHLYVSYENKINTCCVFRAALIIKQLALTLFSVDKERKENTSHIEGECSEPSLM